MSSDPEIPLLVMFSKLQLVETNTRLIIVVLFIIPKRPPNNLL